MNTQLNHRTIPTPLSRWFQRRPVRFALFCATFVLGFLFLTRGSGRILEALPYIIFFPLGLSILFFRGLPVGSNPSGPFLILGWLIFLSIALLGTFTPKQRTFIVTYILFVMLLIANMVGCAQYS